MKTKTCVFLVLLIVLLAGAGISGTAFGNTLQDPGIGIETLYGDLSSLDGVKVGLSYVTYDSLLWKSEVTFAKDGFSADTDFRYVDPLKDQRWYNKWTDRETLKDKDVRTDVKKAFGLRVRALAGDKTGYFYPAEGADTDKAEGLPEGNGVYAMDYGSTNVEYAVNPIEGSVRLLADLGPGSIVRSIGYSEDGKYLEIFYEKDGMLRAGAVDLGSEKTVSDIGLVPLDKTGEEMYFYYPADLNAEGISDIAMAASDKGFTLLANEDGKLTKAVERKFTKDDGPEGFADWTRKKAYRWLKTSYDGDRLVFCFRIAGRDVINKKLSGTGITAYDRDGLRYAGVITSELISLERAKIRDFYEEMYDPGWFVTGENRVSNELSEAFWNECIEEGRIDPETGEFYDPADQETYDNFWSFESEDFASVWEEEDMDDESYKENLANEIVDSLYYSGSEFSYFTVDYVR